MTTSEICIIMKYKFKLQSTASDPARNINKAYAMTQLTNGLYNIGLKDLKESLEKKQRWASYGLRILFARRFLVI